jgi:hypothetical protein
MPRDAGMTWGELVAVVFNKGSRRIIHHFRHEAQRSNARVPALG